MREIANHHKDPRFDKSGFEIDSHETLASNGLIHDALLRESEGIFAGRSLEPCQIRVSTSRNLGQPTRQIYFMVVRVFNGMEDSFAEISAEGTIGAKTTRI